GLRIDAQRRGDRAGDLLVLERRADLHGAAELAKADGVLQAVFFKQDARQIVGHGAETRDAQHLTAQIFEPIDLRLHKQPVIRPIGRAHDRDELRAAQHGGDRCVGRGEAGLEIAAEERLYDDGTRRDINQLGVDAVALERADLLRHPGAGRHGADRRIAEDHLGALGRLRAGSENQREKKRRQRNARVSLLHNRPFGLAGYQPKFPRPPPRIATPSVRSIYFANSYLFCRGSGMRRDFSGRSSSSAAIFATITCGPFDPSAALTFCSKASASSTMQALSMPLASATLARFILPPVAVRIPGSFLWLPR